MKNNHTLLKFGFGALIFIFSLSLAYFTASYVTHGDTTPAYVLTHGASYWYVLMTAAGVYALIGILVSLVFPVSLGFLTASSVLILHLLVEKYDTFDLAVRIMLVGVILIVLYMAAWMKMQDEPAAAALIDSTPVIPPSSRHNASAANADGVGNKKNKIYTI
jgi:hypothetical protein